MSDLLKEISWLKELSDEQQEVLAGGKLGTPFQFKSPSGLSRIGFMPPLIMGSLWNPGSKDDDEHCHETKTKNENGEIVKVVCEKTEKYP